MFSSHRWHRPTNVSTGRAFRAHSGRLSAGIRSRPLLANVLAVAALLVVLGQALPMVGTAADRGKIITLGESLSEPQKQELLSLFGYQAGEDEEPLIVTTADTVKAMEGIFPAERINSAFSSTALSCRKLGEGLDVTTNNITLVTPGLYAMALVTAGIGDATLVVAAPAGLADVQGMTALTGVFETWEIAPCDSGNTTKARQRLALEELTLTVQIGQALASPDGVQKATDVVLEAQKTVVTKRLTSKGKIDQAIARQEAAAGVTIPPDLRTKLVDLMTRLAKEEIDWSTFSAGWTIERPEASRITMTGDGIAIRNAQASATAEANAAMTATAEAANARATAEANAAATASAEAQAMLDAEMTATARAQPTSTATPSPTATPPPSPTPSPIPTPATVGVEGTVADIGEGHIAIVQDGGSTSSVTYRLDADVTIMRGDQQATLDAIGKGDRAILTIDGATQLVTNLVVAPTPATTEDRPLQPAMLGIIGLLGIALIKRRRGEEPFVLERKSSSRETR